MAASQATRRAGERDRPALVLYQLAVILPVLVFLLWQAGAHSEAFHSPVLLMWVLAIAVVDLLPVPTSSTLHFSLSFPLQLAVALIYPPAVAGTIALAGTSDPREFQRRLSILKAVFIRAQIAMSVIVESLVFHAMASVRSPGARLAMAVACATILGYSINVLLVALYARVRSGQPVLAVVRQMHVGLFGEFLVSYMGLALFGVVIAIFFVSQGVWSIAVFVAPMAFARQMFARTHSLQVATEELAARQREKEHEALHDPLTGLPNRVLFVDRLHDAVASPPGTRLAVLIMDLDQFKEVNDALGHHFGDVMLQQVAPRLSEVVRRNDTVARLGGDEFGVVVPDIESVDEAVAVAQRLLDALEAPMVIEGLALDVAGSIGISLYPDHAEDVDTLVRNADVAMYAAKEAQSGYEVYEPERDRHSPDRLALLGQVRPAVEANEFVLYYQPKADLGDGGIYGVEALLRWQHPRRGLLFPDQFIPLTERTVLLRPLTLFVIEQALRQCEAWRLAGVDLEVAINLSPRNLLDLELPDHIGRMLRRCGLPPTSLRLEITEHSLMSDSHRSVEVLARLSMVGVGLSIDDFGTGYSSLGYLKRLPVDELKIDKSFVSTMHRNPNDGSIVKATIDLSHNLGLRVVAEGVETPEAWRQLTVLGCDRAQGYLLSPAVSPSDLVSWLHQRQRNRDSDDVAFLDEHLRRTAFAQPPIALTPSESRR